MPLKLSYAKVKFGYEILSTKQQTKEASGLLTRCIFPKSDKIFVCRTKLNGIIQPIRNTTPTVRLAGRQAQSTPINCSLVNARWRGWGSMIMARVFIRRNWAGS